MKKFIFILLIMFTGLVIGCSDEPTYNINSLLPTEYGNAEYVINGDGGDVSFFYKDGHGDIIEKNSVTLPQIARVDKFYGDSLSCGISSTNLSNYNNISIEMYYNGEYVGGVVPEVTDLKLQVEIFIDK